MGDEPKARRGDIAAIAIFVVACFLCGGLGLGWRLSSLGWKREAVEKGHAEWYVENHVKEWRWKPVPGAEETE